MKRYLIITADERTWKFDRPVLFLGEWCRLYHRRSVWERMDAIVAEPYGFRPGQQDRDLAYVQLLADHLLEELTETLNTVHGTRHSLRYWRIVLGHWLQRYVAVTFNRYFCLEQTLANHEISGATVVDFGGCPLATANSDAFVWASNDASFNGVLHANILRFWGNLATEGIADSSGNTSRPAGERTVGRPSLHPIARLKSVVMETAHRVLPLFSRERDAVLIKTYLPGKTELALQVALGQCPQLWRSPRLTPVAPDPRQRQSLRVGAADHDGFEGFVRAQLPEVIPTCYLEGYRDLVRQAGNLPWPSRPKFIFTSNNFDTDEVFKVWTASRVQEGIPYFVGQHGNNSGALLGSLNWPEIVTSDRFFTWGWTSEDPRTVPAFIFRGTTRLTPRKAPTRGGLLLIEVHLPHSITPWDCFYEFGEYQAEQFRFLDALPVPIREMLTVRLHAASRRFNWSDTQRWRERAPAVRVESGVEPIASLIRESRLIVHSYDSTGILETLAANRPTLCFWRGGLEHLMSDARPYYELLRAAGILHDTPESAARAVAEHWGDVERWWAGRDVQNARAVFCHQYARTVTHPVRTMKRLLATHAEMALSGVDAGTKPARCEQ